MPQPGQSMGQYQIADADTPLIANAWYVAATSEEIGDALMDRWILGHTVLLYRTEDGRAVAMDNRCPHRSFPLSHGHRTGDNVACGYHGMTFSPEGQCVRMPPISRAPSHIRTRVFPVVERFPLIWVWMGDPAVANELLIPAHQPLEAPGWARVSGYAHVKANYVGLQENLQDLSHFEHLHSSSVGAPDQAIADIVVDAGDDVITSSRVYRNVMAPPIWKDLLNLGGDRITRRIDEVFRSPALCEAATTITDDGPPEGERPDYALRIFHFITPESQHTTHYFWFFMRDFALDDPGTGEAIRAGIAAAFHEDKEALELISALSRQDTRTNYRELSFQSDKGGILLRRRLARMVNDERVDAIAAE